MKALRNFVPLLLAVVLAACSSVLNNPSSTPAREITLDPSQSLVEGQLIIGYQQNEDPAQLAARIGASVLTDWPQISAALLQLPENIGVSKAESIFGNMRGVRYAQPNKVFWNEPEPSTAINPTGMLSPTAVIDDPDFDKQWQHRQLNTEAAWDLGTTGQDIRIGIHDSFVDHRHPDLVDNILYPGYDGFNSTLIEETTPHDGISDHGSSVAGSAAASANAIGGRGVAYEADIVPLNIADPVSGALVLDAIVDAAIFAVDGPDGAPGGTDRAPGTDPSSGPYVHIVNMSWGGGGYDQAVKDAMDYMLAFGVTLVTSAGNTPTQSYAEPAWHPGLITVAATNPNDERTGFSNRGNYLNVAAPGQNVWVTTTRSCVLATPDGSSCTAADADYTFISGTSFSSPFTAGVAALILDASAERDSSGNITNINLSPAQVRQVLEQSAYQPNGDIFNKDLGYGIVDAAAAVTMALDNSQWPAPGATLVVDAVLASDTSIGLSKVSLSLVPLDRDGPTEYTQTADGKFWVEGQGLFQEINPGRYLLTASGPHTATTGIEAATFEKVVDLQAGATTFVTAPLNVTLFDDLNEPNDAVAAATPATLGTTTRASLYNPSSGDDIDIYAISVTAGSSYRVNLETISGSFDTYLRVLAADGTTVIAENDNNQAQSLDSLVDFTATSTGTVYLEVTDISASDSPGNVYEMDIATFIGSETEPNGSADVSGATISNVDLGNAQAIAFGSAIDATLSSGTDDDIFAVTVTAGTTIVADVETLTDGDPDTMIAIYAADGSQVAFNDDFTGRESRVNYEVTADGTYYVLVVAWDNDTPATGNYGLTITSHVNP